VVHQASLSCRVTRDHDHSLCIRVQGEGQIQSLVQFDSGPDTRSVGSQLSKRWFSFTLELVKDFGDGSEEGWFVLQQDPEPRCRHRVDQINFLILIFLLEVRNQVLVILRRNLSAEARLKLVNEFNAAAW